MQTTINKNQTPPLKTKKVHAQPKYSVGEEIFNSVTHWIGVAIGIAFIAISSVIISNNNPATYKYLACIFFGISMIILYGASSMYHSLPMGRAKRVFRVFDHCSIFLLIAGTYTPFCLITFHGLTIGTVIFCIQWILTIIGITFNAINMNWKAVKVLSMLSYVVMGWCIVFSWEDLMLYISNFSFWFLLIGGCCYTFGLFFYGFGKKVKYFHSIWHLFVLAGTVFHIFSVFGLIN